MPKEKTTEPNLMNEARIVSFSYSLSSGFVLFWKGADGVIMKTTAPTDTWVTATARSSEEELNRMMDSADTVFASDN